MKEWSALLFAITATVHGQPSSCNAAAPSPSVNIDLPSNPFRAVVTRDGCWIFASLGNGIAVLKRSGGTIAVERTVPIPRQEYNSEALPAPVSVAGLALTHDQELLIGAANYGAVFLDVQSLISGANNAVAGFISTTGGPGGSVYVNVTSDDKRVFVSEEGAESITVIDLEKARRDGYTSRAIIGKIPTGEAPIALTFSPDEKWLYSTSERSLQAWNWPGACGPNSGVPAGAVLVVDVERARTNPAQSVVSEVPAGCDTVRAAVSPKGDRLYVTSRIDNLVLTFDAEKLRTDPDHALLRITTVGPAPVPIAVIDNGRKILAGNSNRFARSSGTETLSILDASKIESGEDALLGTIPTGAFPREMDISADGNTLFVTNAASHSLQIIDLQHLPLTPPRP